MSGFSDLVGNGADCAPGTGLGGLMKQLDRDHSLEQATAADRFSPAQASSSRQAFRQAFRQNAPAASPAAAAEGLQAQGVRPQGPGPFNFGDMRHQLGGIQARPPADWSADFARHQHHAAGMAPPPPASHAELERAFARAAGGPALRPAMPISPHAAWADQFQRAPAVQALPAGTAAAAAAAATVAAVPAGPSPMALAFNEARMYTPMMGPGMAMPPMAYAQQQQQQQQRQQVGDSVDAAEQGDGLALAAAQVLDSVRGSANPKFKSSEFLSFMQQLADGHATIAGDKVVASDKGKQAEAVGGPTWATEFERRAEELVGREGAGAGEQQQQTPADGKIFSGEFARGLERNWAEEFEQALDGPLEESAVSGHPGDMDVKVGPLSSDNIHGEASKDWLEQFKDSIEPMLNEQDREWLDTQKEWENLTSIEASYRATDPELSVYRFQRDNRFADMAGAPLRDEIRRMLASPEAASLGDAIMAMEAAVAQEPQDAGMWLQLGLKQQENEQEQAAIAALRKAVAVDPDSLDAHLALAVSYTNEGYRTDAYDELHEWIARHPRYRELVPATAPERMSDADARKDYIQDLYIRAARMAPGQDWDPDVQVALGVLFNISTEYDKAVDCFKAALSKRPDDYILWNRLGATQAHVGRNREATAAYFRALELHPSFIRARYNMSLASTNMGQHREAAENCLIALSLQQREMQAAGDRAAAAGAGMSGTIWNALQLSMYMLSEPKLAEACERQDLEPFRAKFEF
ncbi:hypothetical protein H4R18_003249 [Coemansia javaensis]|uniref:Peroxin-5 n=1 Tax=Coemansia javaensis TaxID=2761396 RepID=A0A9W8LGK9_9FUNG|nr:hypothetical protein H4R18_003249 [Coemansia javaensis]